MSSSTTKWVACNCSWSFWSGSHQAGRDLPSSATVPAGGKAKPQTALHWREVVSHPITSFSYTFAFQLLHLLDRHWQEPHHGQMLQQLLGRLPPWLPPDDEEEDFQNQVLHPWLWWGHCVCWSPLVFSNVLSTRLSQYCPTAVFSFCLQIPHVSYRYWNKIVYIV